MGKIIAVAAAAAFLTLTAGSASAAFSIQSLTGTYVFQVRGFWANEPPPPPFHTGELAALGLLKFNGQGAVLGIITFTGADSGGDQVVCDGAIDSSKSRASVNANGTGTLLLVFTTASNCAVAGTPPTGTFLRFRLILNNEDGKSASLLFNEKASDFAKGFTIGGEFIDTLVLQGGLRRQGTEE